MDASTHLRLDQYVFNGGNMNRNKLRLLVTVWGGIIALPSVAVAQSAGSTSANPMAETSEIVVTAQKREQNLQEVPISITALGGDALDKGTAEGVAEALRSVPGVSTLSDRNALGTQVVVRGVAGGGLFSGSGAPIAYYLDSVPFGLVRTAVAPDATAYDLERVEVLRGPQGTLYGASALNGVVRVLTKDVDLDRFELKARGQASVTRYGGWNYRGDAAANLPIVEDRLGLRVTAGYQDFSGWIDRASARDANDAKMANVRVKLKAQPTDNLTIGLSAWISRGDYGAPNTGDGSRFNSATVDEPSTVDFDIYALNLRYDLGPVTISSATSYLKYSSFNILDYGPFCIGCGGFTQTNNLNSKVFTEELLVNSNGSGPWRWSLGGFFRDASDRSSYEFPGSPAGGFNDDSKSIAVFGEITHLFGDGQFELTGGLRYFRDRVKMADRAPGSTIRDSATFESTTPRAVLTWHPGDRTMIYASYSQGFRSGVVQAPEVITVGFPPAAPDRLTNYEIGAKTDLLDRKLSVELSAYYIDWDDVQQSLAVPIGNTFYTGIVNGASASGFGADFSLVARPANGLSFGGNISVNNLELDQDVLSGGLLLFHKGDRLNQSPRLTFGGFGAYDFDVGGGYSANFSISANHTSRVSLRSLQNGVLYVSPSDRQFVGHASVAIRAPEHWELKLFVDNFTNEQGVTLSNAFPDPYSTTPRSFIPAWDGRPRPRTVGLQLDFRY